MELTKHKLSDIAAIDISGVDKKTVQGETSVRLCNFVDVYRNWAITADIAKDFMCASAKDAEIDRYRIRKGQVAITKDSETRDDIGVSTYIADNFSDVLLGYHCALITPNEKVVDGKYLNAFFHTRYIQTYFENNASGSGQRYTLSNDTINSIPVLLPSIEIQRVIGKQFSDIDRKISLNRAINHNLEAMAKQLYDYWFVQFDFPDENGRPYKSSGGRMVYNEKLKREIPEGWDVTQISEVAIVKKGDVITEKDSTPGNIKVVAGGIDFSYRNGVSNRTANTITVSGSGANAGYINFWREPIFASDCTTVNCDDCLDTILCLYGMRLLQDRLYNLAVGAAQPHIYPNHVNSLPILIIPNIIKEKVRRVLCASNDRIKGNEIEIECLTKPRDELLPLLMNGQVSVNYDL